MKTLFEVILFDFCMFPGKPMPAGASMAGSHQYMSVGYGELVLDVRKEGGNKDAEGVYKENK